MHSTDEPLKLALFKFSFEIPKGASSDQIDNLASLINKAGLGCNEQLKNSPEIIDELMKFRPGEESRIDLPPKKARNKRLVRHISFDTSHPRTRKIAKQAYQHLSEDHVTAKEIINDLGLGVQPSSLSRVLAELAYNGDPEFPGLRSMKKDEYTNVFYLAKNAKSTV